MKGLHISLPHEETRSRMSVHDAINRFAFFAIVTVLFFGVHGCPLAEGLAYEDDDLPEEYAVWAADTLSNAAIVKKRGGGTGIHVVDLMVFAYGWDEDFIVAQQHPVTDGKVDTTVTHWFIIEVRRGAVHGPLTEQAYCSLRNKLNVSPETTFTKWLRPE